MSTRTATGRKELRQDTTYLVMTREFRAPVEDVWAAVTESDRLARWIGTWTWHLELDLAEADGVTTLTFAQSVPDPAMAHDVGPGWDYYLDRMVVAESGGDVAAVVFDDYYPALAEHYKGEFGS